MSCSINLIVRTNTIDLSIGSYASYYRTYNTGLIIKTLDLEYKVFRIPGTKAVSFGRETHSKEVCATEDSAGVIRYQLQDEGIKLYHKEGGFM